MTRLRSTQDIAASPRRFNWPTFQRPNLLLVEGPDEYHFFRFMLQRDDVQIHVYEGKNQLRLELATIRNVEGFDQVQKAAIVRDADNDPKAAVLSVLAQWSNAFGKSQPRVPSDVWFPDDEGRQWSVWIMPAPDLKGDLEELLWQAVVFSDHRSCIDELITCLDGCNPIPFSSKTKARFYAWLSTQRAPLKELHEALKSNRHLFGPTDSVFARFVALIDSM